MKSAACIKRRSALPASGTYARPPNQYVTWQPNLAKEGLLKVFYIPVLDLARLIQATAVPQDLEPLEIELRRTTFSGPRGAQPMMRDR